MLNKKDNLIIFVLCLIVISLGGLIMLKNFAGIKIAKNTNINLNQNQNINKTVNQNINQNINTNQKPKDEYKGELIKEADGWKKYRNEYWGIEFRFRDEKDEIKIQTRSMGVILSNTNIESVSKDYIYIDIFCYNDKDFDNFQDYIEKSKIWDPGQGAPAPAVTKLISIEEKTNKNNTKYIRTDYKYSEICKFIEGYECDTKTLYDGFSIFFKSPIHNDYCKERNSYDNTGYIDISNVKNKIGTQIIDTFKFID